MTEEEFLKLVNDFVRGRLCHSETGDTPAST